VYEQQLRGVVTADASCLMMREEQQMLFFFVSVLYIFLFRFFWRFLILIPLLGVSRVRLGRNSLNNHRHETVKGAAQLGALAVEHTLTLDERMRLVETARDAIHLDTDAW